MGLRFVYRPRIWLMTALIITLFTITPLSTFAQDDGNQSATPPQLPDYYRLNIDNLTHIYQGWNNCGPATLTMGLSYFGNSGDQKPAANWLKPHYEDKNVNPWEMADYVNSVAGQSLNVRALYRPAGNLELLKTLLAADFPVIIEEGYEPEAELGWMGHYLLLIGYDENELAFLSYDSYLGHNNFEGRREPYERLSETWSHFGNMFIVLYPPEREAEVLSLLGDLATLEQAWQMQATHFQQLATANPDNGWNWFNIGDALTHLGMYEQATDYFRIAFEKRMPWRTLWYRHTPFEAFYRSGDFDTTIQLVQDTKLTTYYVEETSYYHGLVFASQGRSEDAKAQFRQALRYNSNYTAAQDAITAIDNGTFQPVIAASQ